MIGFVDGSGNPGDGGGELSDPEDEDPDDLLGGDIGNNEPPINWTRVGVGTLAGGVFLIAGVSTFAIWAGIFFEDPPAGAFIAGGGVLLTGLSIEILYQAWRPVLPNTWPEYIIINPLHK